MPDLLIIWLLSAGITYVSGSSCNITTCVCELKQVYQELVDYEKGFPIYGENETELGESCDNIQSSFEHIDNYLYECAEDSACKNKTSCINIVREINNFVLSSSLRELTKDLCTKNSPMQTYYMENIQCLKKYADKYAAYHKDYEKLMDDLKKHTQHLLEKDCCIVMWYKDCVINVTRDNCGENATSFVSSSVHKIVDIDVCKTYVSFCNATHPWLLGDDYDDDYLDITVNSIATTIKSQKLDGDLTYLTVISTDNSNATMVKSQELDDDKTDLTVISTDNSNATTVKSQELDDDKTDLTVNSTDNSNIATIKSHVTHVMALAYLFVMLYQNFL